MKRLGRDAAELTALADHLTTHGLILEMLGGSRPGVYNRVPGRQILFGFFAGMAEVEREGDSRRHARGLDAAARQGRHGGRPKVITDDMTIWLLRRQAEGEKVEAPSSRIFSSRAANGVGSCPASPASTGRWLSTGVLRRTRTPSA